MKTVREILEIVFVLTLQRKNFSLRTKVKVMVNIVATGYEVQLGKVVKQCSGRQTD